MKVLNDLVAQGFAANASAFAGGGGSVVMSQVTVNFGTFPVTSALFTLTGATLGQKVMALATTEGSMDDLEMDGLVVSGKITATDTLVLAITAVPGPVVGSRTINVLLG